MTIAPLQMDSRHAVEKASPVEGETAPAFTAAAMVEAARRFRENVYVVCRPDGARGVAFGQPPIPDRISGYTVIALLPPLYPEWLGDRAFTERHGVRFPYVVGEMARGIATPGMVVAAGRAGLLGMFGAAGLSVSQVSRAVDEIARTLEPDGLPWGVNIIHQPAAMAQEQALVDLLLARSVRCASASAFLGVTDPLVHYACAGLSRAADGTVLRRNRLIAKVSRPEIARQFLQPAPEVALGRLAEAGRLTAEECALARQIPLVLDLTVEADSGGHTDRRPLVAVFPVIRRLADDIARQSGRDQDFCLGAAGGIGTPAAVAAAFSMGAAYVLTGSINQATRESAISAEAREMLGAARVADFATAPSADMFELGANVQVLQRGTLFPQRASRLLALYREHDSLENIPADIRRELERDTFGMPLNEVWELTKAYLIEDSPQLVARAEREDKVRMALVFRWYIGLSSRWPVTGDSGRRADFQLWAGPALGACNTWLADTPYENVHKRSVVSLAWNLLEGAAMLTRAQQLRSLGAPVPAGAFIVSPEVFA